MAGVILGVGLFCGVLFFVDGLSASMTQRAVAPLAIDMQRIVTQRPGATLTLTETIEIVDAERVEVSLELRHDGHTPANEVTIRSVPDARLDYVVGSATLDGKPLGDADGNPFASGATQGGHNLGRVEPGTVRRASYTLTSGSTITEQPEVDSTYSSRESVSPISANQPPPASLDELAALVADLPGVDHALPLSIADLGASTLHTGGRIPGPAKIFGFDDAYADADAAIDISAGGLSPDGAVVSAEVARDLSLAIGDAISIDLPDGTTVDLDVTGVADLSRARALFSSRRGGDLETFIYVPHSVVVSPSLFASDVFPAFERAASVGSGRLKSPPIREIDIGVARGLLDADPSSAVSQTEVIGAGVMGVAAHQDYLLDNITNTLHVAADDSRVAKRLFVFLGVPGALLAAMLAAYAGNVLAEAQRRETAILRIRGANRGHLLRMLALRTALLTAAGALVGLVAGYGTTLGILGHDSLARASTSSLATSAATGTLGGYLATGAALYITGRRSIDREINDDRRRLVDDRPLWRRARLDLVGLAILAAGTIVALRTDAFAGSPGSVYFGRSVELNLTLLVLPIAAWVTGSLIAARVIGGTLSRTAPASTSHFQAAAPALARRSIGRRPWAISNAAIVAALIVGLATSLGAFTASYDQAKTRDARYANGADIRMTPSPTSDRTFTVDDAATLTGPGISDTTPVIYGLSNVILRSDRTSDPANLAAIEPDTFAAVAPVDTALEQQLTGTLDPFDSTVLVSSDMAEFLKAGPGDTLHVLLARATPDQAEIDVTIAGLFERLPGFPDGADAIVHIDLHTNTIASKHPDFFLAATVDDRPGTLDRAVTHLQDTAAAGDTIQIDTRTSTLDRDQSSLAALNIAGLVDLDSAFSLAMATAAIVIFVFGLLLQRRREYIVLRAQGLAPSTIRGLITVEATVAAITGTLAGIVVGAVMGYYFVAVLRPLFVLDPGYRLPLGAIMAPVLLVVAATIAASLAGSRVVNTLQPTELLRDE